MIHYRDLNDYVAEQSEFCSTVTYDLDLVQGPTMQEQILTDYEFTRLKPGFLSQDISRSDVQWRRLTNTAFTGFVRSSIFRQLVETADAFETGLTQKPAPDIGYVAAVRERRYRADIADHAPSLKRLKQFLANAAEIQYRTAGGGALLSASQLSRLAGERLPSLPFKHMTGRKLTQDLR